MENYIRGTVRLIEAEIGEKKSHEIVGDFWKNFTTKETFGQFFDSFSYNVIVFTPDGSMCYANRTLCEKMNIQNPLEIAGRYNIFKDPFFADNVDLQEFLQRVFSGLAASRTNIIVPVGRITPTRSKPQIVMGYPIFDGEHKLSYIVIIFHDSMPKEKEEFTLAKNFIHETWREEFDLERIAKYIGVSERHIQRLFKEQGSDTPFSYYKLLKIRKIKDTLHKKELSIAEAFVECGVDYSGTYAAYFKEIVGITPSEYRKNLV
ncbi:MAG: helix-turn-helix transcriptional regulator [Firmicutes bacterium]|nr:helix-turn-helix transcriptional regulator [Bacillota bacterium]MCL2771609.1 helix-turn-helix transcriptional regulator [Bacillota bacterium]